MGWDVRYRLFIRLILSHTNAIPSRTEAGVFASQVFDPTRDPSDWPYVKLTKGYDFHFTPFDEENPDQGYQLVMSVSFRSWHFIVALHQYDRFR